MNVSATRVMARFGLLSMSSMVKKVVTNTSWLTAEKVLTMFVSLGVGIFLARELGPAVWGKLNYMLAIVALLGPFTSLGLNSIITREIINHEAVSEQSQHADVVGKIVVTALVYRLMGGLIGSLICAAVYLVSIGGSSSELALIIALLVSSIFGAGQVVEFWFQAQMLNKYVAIYRFCLFCLFSSAKVVAVLIQVEFWQLVAVFAVEIMVVGIGYIVLYARCHQSINFRLIDFDYGWRLLKQSLWLVLSGLAAVLYLKVDQIMLARMVGDEAVGIYSVAVKLSEVWFFFPAAFAAAVFPTLLQSRANNDGRYQRKLQISCDALLGSALLVILAVVVTASTIVPLLFGREYAASATVLIIHIWGGLFVFMRALVSKWLVSEALLPYSLWSHGFGAVINICLNVVLIPQYSYWGAAWATVISYAFSGYLCFWFFAKTRPIAIVMSRSLLFPFNWRMPFRVL